MWSSMWENIGNSSMSKAKGKGTTCHALGVIAMELL